MACASPSWDSGESAPSDMPPVEKRLTISLAGSTSSTGIGGELGAQLQQPAQQPVVTFSSLTRSAKRS